MIEIYVDIKPLTDQGKRGTFESTNYRTGTMKKTLTRKTNLTEDEDVTIAYRVLIIFNFYPVFGFTELSRQFEVLRLCNCFDWSVNFERFLI